MYWTGEHIRFLIHLIRAYNFGNSIISLRGCLSKWYWEREKKGKKKRTHKIFISRFFSLSFRKIAFFCRTYWSDISVTYCWTHLDHLHAVCYVHVHIRWASIIGIFSPTGGTHMLNWNKCEWKKKCTQINLINSTTE